jgi:hypothetical protein
VPAAAVIHEQQALYILAKCIKQIDFYNYINIKNFKKLYKYIYVYNNK